MLAPVAVATEVQLVATMRAFVAKVDRHNSYRVTFDHNIEGCVPVAATAAGTPPAPVSAGLAGAGLPNAVYVVTSNPTDAFHLAVVC